MKRYLKINQYGDVFVVSTYNGEWAVVDKDDNEIVPFGKYGWIDGFDHGLARVCLKSKWGIIDMQGEEVLPLEYDEIWNFLGKGRSDTRVIKDGDSQQFDLNEHILYYSRTGSKFVDEYANDPGWDDVMLYSKYCDAIEGNSYDPDCDYDDPEMIAMYWNTD